MQANHEYVPYVKFLSLASSAVVHLSVSSEKADNRYPVLHQSRFKSCPMCGPSRRRAASSRSCHFPMACSSRVWKRVRCRNAGDTKERYREEVDSSDVLAEEPSHDEPYISQTLQHTMGRDSCSFSKPERKIRCTELCEPTVRITVKLVENNVARTDVLDALSRGVYSQMTDRSHNVREYSLPAVNKPLHQRQTRISSAVQNLPLWPVPPMSYHEGFRHGY